jgi:hypothetical protein
MEGYLDIAWRIKEERDSRSHLTALQKEVEHWDEDRAFRDVHEAMRHLADHYVKDAVLNVLDPWEKKVQKAYEAEDIEALRTAVEGLFTSVCARLSGRTNASRKF